MLFPTSIRRSARTPFILSGASVGRQTAAKLVYFAHSRSFLAIFGYLIPLLYQGILSIYYTQSVVSVSPSSLHDSFLTALTCRMRTIEPPSRFNVVLMTSRASHRIIKDMRATLPCQGVSSQPLVMFDVGDCDQLLFCTLRRCLEQERDGSDATKLI